MANKYKLINDKLNNNQAGFVLVISLIVILIIISAAFIYAAETSLQANVQVLGNISFITINSPLQGEMYNTKKILINISLLEQANILYYQLNSGKLSKLCKNCINYEKTKGFSEGQNNLTILAVKYDNTNEYSATTFYTDTKKPKINSLYPSKIGNGLFGVKYTELNLENVTLYYGLNSANPENKIEFTGCISGTKIDCYNFVDISSYNNKYIYYKFLVQDSFYSIYSKQIKILVNASSPALLANNVEEFSVLDDIVSFIEDLFED